MAANRLYEKTSASEQKDTRNPYQKDFDRVLYSSAFQRLGNITQVINPTSNEFISNRLTHSLKVSQLAKRVSDYLLISQPELKSFLKPHAAAAAGLAHDLGHPPFGHIGEKALDYIMRSGAPEFGSTEVFQGFEGNAQSFRVITQTSIRDQAWSGLNLTRTTLNAVIKYPWKRDSGQKAGVKAVKWGVYAGTADEDVFNWVREIHSGPQEGQSLEAQIMDWSDDVAYAIYDCIDFFRAGLTPLGKLLEGDTREGNPSEEGNKFYQWALEEKILDQEILILGLGVLENLGLMTEHEDSHDARASIKDFCSTLLDRFIYGLRVVESGGHHQLIIPEKDRAIVAVLKKINWRYVINHPSLRELQEGHSNILKDIFAYTVSLAESEPFSAMPPIYAQRYKDDSDSQAKKRVICDYISSLSENAITRKYQRITGQNSVMNFYT